MFSLLSPASVLVPWRLESATSEKLCGETGTRSGGDERVHPAQRPWAQEQDQAASAMRDTRGSEATQARPGSLRPARYRQDNASFPYDPLAIFRFLLGFLSNESRPVKGRKRRTPHEPLGLPRTLREFPSRLPHPSPAGACDVEETVEAGQAESRPCSRGRVQPDQRVLRARDDDSEAALLRGRGSLAPARLVSAARRDALARPDRRRPGCPRRDLHALACLGNRPGRARARRR